ncbi:unnamed protein product [Lepidochelys kempii]
MKGTKLLTVTLALLTLLALKAYMDWSLEQPEHLPAPEPAWHPSPLPLTQPLGDDPAGLLLRLNASLQRLRRSVPEADAYWNRQLRGLFRALEGGPANGTWGCGDGPAAAAAIRDFASYPDQHRRFVLHAGCRSFPLLVNQPHKCAGNGTFLLLAIKSVPGNFAARQAVRETWGREGAHGGQPVRTIFLMGAAHGPHQPDLRRLIAAESQAYGDVLVWDFEDTFFNLTLKDFLFLGWALAHCPDARFVLKGDDDVFINTPRVLAYLGALDTHRPDAVHRAGHGQRLPLPPGLQQVLHPRVLLRGAVPGLRRRGRLHLLGPPGPGPLPAGSARGLLPHRRRLHRALLPGAGGAGRGPPRIQTFDIAEKDRADPCAHRQLLLVHRRSRHRPCSCGCSFGDPQLKC